MLYDNMLKQMFRLNTEEVTRIWRKLYNEGFHNFCFSPDIRVIKKDLMDGTCNMHEKMRNFCQQPKRKRPIGKTRHRL
jgi:hypothetical protein